MIPTFTELIGWQQEPTEAAIIDYLLLIIECPLIINN